MSDQALIQKFIVDLEIKRSRLIRFIQKFKSFDFKMNIRPMLSIVLCVDYRLMNE